MRSLPPLILSLLHLSSGCIPTYNPDFPDEVLTTPRTQTIMTMPVQTTVASTAVTEPGTTTMGAQPTTTTTTPITTTTTTTPHEVLTTPRTQTIMTMAVRTTAATQPDTTTAVAQSTTATTVTQPTTTTTTVTTTTTTTKPPCPDGWTLNPDTMFCYFVNMDISLTWPDAENFCMMTPGGHMTSIADMTEYDYLWNLVRDKQTGFMGLTSFLVGASSPAPDMNQFTWFDGTPFVYTDWSNVNSQGNAEVCLYVYMTPTDISDGYRYAECDNAGFLSVCKAPAM